MNGQWQCGDYAYAKNIIHRQINVKPGNFQINESKWGKCYTVSGNPGSEREKTYPNLSFRYFTLCF